MNNFERFPEPIVSIPENSDAFKDWEKRRDAGELNQVPSESTLPTEIPEVQVRIPEDSDAFKEWERNRNSEDQANS